MRLRAVLVALAILAAAGAARATQDAFPALYDVVDVASNDVLNVRAAPSPSADIVGALDWNARGIEVIEMAPGVDWGLVNTREASGWVSLRYMRRRAGQWMGAFPEVASCFGTEPFWSLTRGAGSWTLDRAGEPAVSWRETWRGAASGRRDRHGIALQGVTGTSASGVIAYEACGDGMSDRSYGLSLDLIMVGPNGGSMLSGCCTLQAR